MIEFRMAVASIDLPDDVELLKAMLRARQAELAERDARIAEFEKKLDYAEERYRAMVMRLFGRKSEHYSPEEDKQNRLFDEAEDHAAEDAPPAILKVHVPAHERAKRGEAARRFGSDPAGRP